MNLPKLAVTVATVLMTTLCSISTVDANSNTNLIVDNSFNLPFDVAYKKIDGGPRDVVQNMADVVVLQPEADVLHVTIVKEGGDVLYTTSSNDLETTISTENWESGEYTIETVDDSNNYQEFLVTID